MKTVQELLAEARSLAADIDDSPACDAVTRLCQAIEQMQPRTSAPDPIDRLCALIDCAQACEAARKEERERIAQLFEIRLFPLDDRQREFVARYIRESAP